MSDSASIVKPAFVSTSFACCDLHAVELRVVLARDADVIDHAEHSARLQRVVDALRERDCGRLAALAVVDVVQVERGDRGVRRAVDLRRPRARRASACTLLEPVVARLLVAREVRPRREERRDSAPYTLPVGPTAADNTSVNQPPTAITSMTVWPVLMPRNWMVWIGLRAASRSLSSAGRSGDSERRAHARDLLVLRFATARARCRARTAQASTRSVSRISFCQLLTVW